MYHPSLTLTVTVLGMWEKALAFLEEMRCGGPGSRPNLRSYTAAIGACARASQWKPALELHETMISEGLSPDNASYNAVIGAARCDMSERDRWILYIVLLS